MLAFRMNLEQAQLFFEICQEMHAEDEKTRLCILKAMCQEGMIASVVETNLSREDYIKHLADKFGRVVNITDTKGTC